MDIETQKKFQNFRAFIFPFLERKSTIEVSDLTIESLKAEEPEKTKILEKIKRIQEQEKIFRAIPDNVFIGLVMTYIQTGSRHESFVKFVQEDLEDTDETKFFEFVSICCLIIEREMDEAQKIVEKLQEESKNIDREKTPTAFEELKKKIDLYLLSQERRKGIVAICNRPREYFDWNKQGKNKFLRYVKYFYEISLPPKQE